MKECNSDYQQEEGFTLIELSMSLIFIAFIMLFLMSTMFSIMQTYNKGVRINQINQAGRQINSDIGDQVRFSKNDVVIRNDKQRLCVGGVTYLWNTSDSVRNWYSGETAANTRLRFARVIDSMGEYCNTDSMPNRNHADTAALLNTGVIVRQFEVTEGAAGLIRIQAVFSTEGGDQPEYNSVSDHWQCGQIIDGVFQIGKNQFCAFAEFDIITYRRIAE